MKHTISRRTFCYALACGALGATAGCGTILYPERRGQPAGPLDWKVVALDAVGLLLFFIPGVIAFAVDFTNGTIYLPPEQYISGYRGAERPELVAVRVPPQEMGYGAIERIVSGHAGQPVQLVEGQFQTQPLASVNHFWPTYATLARRSPHTPCGGSHGNT